MFVIFVWFSQNNVPYAEVLSAEAFDLVYNSDCEEDLKKSHPKSPMEKLLQFKAVFYNNTNILCECW